MNAYSNESNIMINFDMVDVKFLMIQASASIINCIFSDSIKDIETKYVNYSDHGYVNALQKQVELVYLLVERMLKGEIFVLLDNGERKLICDALREYQEYKTDFCKREQEEYGENYGIATGFYKAKWDKYNEKFMKGEKINISSK